MNRSLVLVLANLLTAALVARGIIDAASKADVANLVADIIGALAFVITACFSVFHYISLHKHSITQGADVAISDNTTIDSSLANVLIEDAIANADQRLSTPSSMPTVETPAMQSPISQAGVVTVSTE